MSKSKAEPRGRAPNFKDDEAKFLLNKIKSNGTFGPLSSKLTSQMKINAWLKIRDELHAAGYPKRAKEQIKRKCEDVCSATKLKYHKKKETGGGSVEWSDIDELIKEILGKGNPTLTSVRGGIDSGDSTTTKEVSKPKTVDSASNKEYDDE